MNPERPNTPHNWTPVTNCGICDSTLRNVPQHNAIPLHPDPVCTKCNTLHVVPFRVHIGLKLVMRGKVNVGEEALKCLRELHNIY